MTSLLRRFPPPLAGLALLALAGCPAPDDSTSPTRMPGYRADVIQRQYVDREEAVAAAMDERMAYQPQAPAGSDSPEWIIAQWTAGETPDPGGPGAATLAEANEQPAKLSNASMPTDSVAAARMSADRLYWGLVSGVPVDDPQAIREIDSLLGYLDQKGRFGETRGGLTRSFDENEWLVRAALATAIAGDDRLRSHPYFAFAHYWLMHHRLPGDQVFLTSRSGAEVDARANHFAGPEIADRISTELRRLAALFPAPSIKWWLENVGTGIPADESPAAAALSALAFEDGYNGPPPYGLYPQAALVLWRSNWNNDADGLLARGAVDEPGATSEMDAGQVTWIAGGQPVLVEAPAPASVQYDDGETIEIPAHNVLRIGVDGPVPGRAPIITRQLDETGGNLRIDASALYPGLSQWHRDLLWETGAELRIIDSITFALGQRDKTALFWHLGASEPVNITTDGSRTIVEWRDSALVIQANAPMEIDQFLIPAGLDPESSEQRAVLVMRTIGRPASIRVLTRVLPREVGEETAEASAVESAEPATEGV